MLKTAQNHQLKCVHPSIHIRLLTKLGKTQGCVQV